MKLTANIKLDCSMAVRSIAKVADAYKLDKKTIRKFRKRCRDIEIYRKKMTT